MLCKNNITEFTVNGYSVILRVNYEATKKLRSGEIVCYRKRDPSLHFKHGRMGGLRDEALLLV